MARHREYKNNAERQRAYRQRQAEELRRLQEGGGGGQRHRVSKKLVKVLGMLGSAHPGERDNAAVKATQILREAGLTWYDVLGVEDD